MSRADVSELLWQPILTYHFKWGYLSWSAQQWVIDWENDNSLSIPLGVVIGKVLLGKTPWNISVEPYYTINNQDRPDEWGVKFQWTAIFPKFHW